MSNKLTSLTGFGEGDPKPEKRTITLKSGEKIEAGKKYREPSKKPLRSWGDELPRMGGAKSSALNKKMGKGSAAGINAERKRQGYKPMDAKRTRIHEGMDKYL